MAATLTNYQCPSCMGPLRFQADSGRLECEYCGSSFAPAEIEAMYGAQNDRAAQAARAEEEKSRTGGEEWDTAAAGGDWGEDAAHLRAYNCPSCGAELICEEETAASSCPYCGNPTVIPGQLSGSLRPDFIIPFRLDKDAATAALKKHYRGKFFLPRRFSEENHIRQLRGVYVPFWLFSAQADADVTFHATRVHTHIEGDDEVTVTEHFQVRRAGSAVFERIPADGSSKMPDDLMDSIEPFDYADLRPFAMAYLPGYLADKYDVSAAECAPRADERCRNSILEILRGDVAGYATVTPESDDIRLQRGPVKYALFPVWLLDTKWKGTDHLFAMNGQTGKLVGDLPVSRAKYWGTFAAVAALAALLLAVSGAAGFLAELIGVFF